MFSVARNSYIGAILGLIINKTGAPNAGFPHQEMPAEPPGCMSSGIRKSNFGVQIQRVWDVAGYKHGT